MKFISQVCVFVIFVFAVDANQRVQRALGKNCPRDIDFPWTCKKCLKYKRKGTRAAFRCPKGYGRYGNRFIVCREDNTWNGDPPVCVKSGCAPIDTSNDVNLVMGLHPKFNDAVITFQCEEDYLLFGASEIYCDGAQWNHPQPRCEAISDLMECDFEKDLCGWTMNHTVIGNQNWTRHIGSTQTGGTGPKRDHTFPNSETGHYMYFESSNPALEGDEAALVSPPYTADLSPMCFEFWYHMLGPEEQGHVGSLAVYVKDQSDDLNDLQPIFYKEGNQGDMWHKGDMFIDSMVESYEIIIKATKKKSYMSDIAIDDVRLYNCTEITTSTTPSTTMFKTTIGTESAATDTTIIATTALDSTITSGPVDDSTNGSTVSSHSSKITKSPLTTINTRSANNITQQPVTQTPVSVSTNMSVDSSTEAPYIKPVTSYTGSPTSAGTVRHVTSNMTTTPTPLTTEQSTRRSITLDGGSTKLITTTKPIVQTTIFTTNVHSTTQATKTTMKSKIPTTVVVTTRTPRTEVTTQRPTTVTSKPTQTPTTRPLPTQMITTKKPLPPKTITTKRQSTREITTTPTVKTTTGKRTTTSTLRPSTSETTPSTQISTVTIKSSTSYGSSYVSSSASQTTKSLVSPTDTPVSQSDPTHLALVTTYLTGASNQTQSITTSLPVSTNKGDKGDNSSAPARSKHPKDETLKPLMIGLGVGIIVGLIIIGVIGWVCMRRRKFYTSRYEDELKPITNAASTQSLNNVDYYQDDFDIEHVQ